jgi:hypothetical protein
MCRADVTTSMFRLSRNSGSLNLQVCNGIALLFIECYSGGGKENPLFSHESRLKAVTVVLLKFITIVSNIKESVMQCEEQS